MNYENLAKLAEKSGVATLLEQVGLRGQVAELIRIGTSSVERDRWRAIRQDYRDFRSSFNWLSGCAREGDPGQMAWMISSMSTVWGVKLEGILSLALRLRGFSPVAVHLNHNSWTERYHEVFGLRRLLHFTVPLSSNGATPDEVARFVAGCPSVNDLLNFEIRNIAVGRIALSNVLDRNKFTRFEIQDPKTLAELSAELTRIRRNVLSAEWFVQKNRPRMALLLEKGLSPMAELFGVCVREGIPVIQYTGSQEMNSFVLKRFSTANRYHHPFSLDATTWRHVQETEWSDTMENELMNDFARSYQEGTWFNRKFLHHNKKIKSPAEVRSQIGLDSRRKTAVIFSHVLWDATFFYGEGLFENYESWLLRTIEAACRNDKVNWIIKLHPDLVWKLKYEGYTGELRDTIAIRSSVGKLPEHIKLVPPETDISSWSFFGITDYCLTVRGTIGIEMACQGIPVITAGSGRYSGLGFTIDSTSQGEYLDRLARIHDQAPMTEEQIERARRFAYALFRQRPWKATSFEIVKMGLKATGHPLDQNVQIKLTSRDQFEEASDLRRFAEWVDSDRVDYFKGN